MNISSLSLDGALSSNVFTRARTALGVALSSNVFTRARTALGVALSSNVFTRERQLSIARASRVKS